MVADVRWAADSSTGLVRAGNEDAAYAGRHLFAVADGMGGHVAGEVASATVINALTACDLTVATADLLGTMSRAVHQANHSLARRVHERPGLAGMGTTLTAMLWSGAHFALAHIGDSRAYRLRDGALRQITEDHSLGMLVAEPGQLAELIARYLDGRPDRSPDLTLREARPGDRYLLCSDGLSGVVAQAAIKTTLQAAATCDEAVRQLTELTYEAGAPDNVSVLVLDAADQLTGAQRREPLILGAAAAGVQPLPA